MTRRHPKLLAVLLAVLGAATLSIWLYADGTTGFSRREPGMDDRPDPVLVVLKRVATNRIWPTYM